MLYKTTLQLQMWEFHFKSDYQFHGTSGISQMEKKAYKDMMFVFPKQIKVGSLPYYHGWIYFSLLHKWDLNSTEFHHKKFYFYSDVYRSCIYGSDTEQENYTPMRSFSLVISHIEIV